MADYGGARRGALVHEPRQRHNRPDHHRRRGDELQGDGISDPVGITTGPDGALWFTNFRSHTIGKVTTGGDVTLYHGKDISRPITITTGPDGALWFTNSGSDTIGRITTDGTVTSIRDSAISGPRGITLGPDGAFWITNQTSHTVARVTSDGASRSSPVTGVPFAITTGPDKSLWVTLPTTAMIARVSTDGTVHPYTSTDISRPLDISSGSDGALWFTNGGASGWIGRITIDGVVTVSAMRSPSTRTWSSVSSANGHGRSSARRTSRDTRSPRPRPKAPDGFGAAVPRTLVVVARELGSDPVRADAYR